MDESLQSYVALKLIRKGRLLPNNSKNADDAAKADDAARIQQLFQEARDLPFFAMELIRGLSLKQRLANGPLPFAEILRIATQIAGDLRHALQFDIVHGGVKLFELTFGRQPCSYTTTFVEERIKAH